MTIGKLSEFAAAACWIVAAVLAWQRGRLVDRRAKLYEDRIESQGRLIKAGIVTCCAIRGDRFVVRKAPEGMTVEEAQAQLDAALEPLSRLTKRDPAKEPS